VLGGWRRKRSEMPDKEKKPEMIIHGTFASLTSEERFRVFLVRKAQMVVAEELIPAIREAVDKIVLLYPEKRGDLRDTFRHYATINVVDELIKFLSQDSRASFNYVTVEGDRTAVTYNDLDPDDAKRWFTRILFGDNSDEMNDWCPTLDDVETP
jgi:hypothetical protein